MSNIFKQFREYQSHNMDNPSYEPLEQPVLEEELLKKRKIKLYAQKYYAKHREGICRKRREKRAEKKRAKLGVTYEDIKNASQKLVRKRYLDELADKISAGLVAQNKELYEENQKLKETLNKIKEAWMKHEKSVDVYYKEWQNSYGDLDQIIMNR